MKIEINKTYLDFMGDKVLVVGWRGDMAHVIRQCDGRDYFANPEMLQEIPRAFAPLRLCVKFLASLIRSLIRIVRS